ncbi:MAG: hypothetical protein HC913_15100 [Microscillaceae bacterium]|nr:hypothetical protein [Microscillaceae bacterium]
MVQVSRPDALPDQLEIQMEAFPAASDSSQTIIEIPFRLSGSLIMVQAQVNEQSGSFIFDSGAPDLKLNTRYFQGGSAVANTAAGGSTGRVENLRLQSIRRFVWPGRVLEEVKVEGFDLSHLEQVRQEKILGLIGFEVFKDYEIGLDYKESKLILYPLDAQGRRLAQRAEDFPADYWIDFRLEGHIPVFPVQIGGQTLQMGLDTGAEKNLLHIQLRSKILSHFQIQKRGVLNGNGQAAVEVFTGEIDKLEIAGHVLYRMRGALTNLDALNEAFGTKLDGLLGFEFLSRQFTTINYRKRRMYIWSEISRLKHSKLQYLASKSSKL